MARLVRSQLLYESVSPNNGRRSNRTVKALTEACVCSQFWGLTSNRNGYSLDLPHDDFVQQYREFRHACPDATKPSHAAFCQRCDNSFPSSIGGVEWLRRYDWREINPLEKNPEPFKLR